MIRLFERSLLLRLGLAMAVITALAFLGMISSVFIAETTQGEAAAVNQAGSLRMQSYRIASSLSNFEPHEAPAATDITERFMNEFDGRLSSPRLVSILRYDEQGLATAYHRVADRWTGDVRPLLVSYVKAKRQLDERGAAEWRNAYLTRVDGFVAEIDHLVGLIEEDAESKIQQLRFIQGLSLFFTLVVVFVTMHLLHTDVLVPLRDLLDCAESARRGNFAVRTAHTGDDELGRLGKSFNVMAEDLSKVYQDLEERVHEKTADLERSNRSLELLYDTTQRLNAAPLSEALYSNLLKNVEKVLGLSGTAICLAEHGATHALKIAATQRVVPGLPHLCSRPRCELCFGDEHTHVVTPPSEAGDVRVLAVPIRHQEQQYGVLLADLPPTATLLEPWQVQLLEAVASHIGMAINMALRSAESHRLALFEERSVIARELHDSLAQSLSYLKIQVSRLDLALQQPQGAEAAGAIVHELREGVSSAYRQLRELLTTFRLKMHGRGLDAALDETLAEFRQRNPDLEFRMEYLLPRGRLSANEEIHVLQIVREALSNVARHSQARFVTVTLKSDAEKAIRVIIEDDGIGIPREAERKNHYGIAIMLERAQGLNGQLHYAPRPEGGTRVELTFKAMSTQQDALSQTGATS
jgi:two-component system nitrate/nitrite sensor histidine kinase NarX